MKKLYKKYNLAYFRLHPILWIYSAYLTLRYVDKFKHFPAIYFKKYIPVKIKKQKKAQIEINTQLVIEPWLGGDGAVKINMFSYSKLIIDGEFVLGNDITILVADYGVLHFKGKDLHSASGITANAVVMVAKNLVIGNDCIIAWDTYLTDSDWHDIDGKDKVAKTNIGNHVWIGVGAKILKGAQIGDNSIVTANSVVLKGQYPEKSMISGNPGKIVKICIPNWTR